ncbi:type I-C CRISPR-associated protein Cas8c/Csd1 [Bifidobacterium sp. SMB2]|uniref:Type I-C CRISPR-associated protein Cas8c/Csd1 n=1 Tax=Bifidobacterium saimiriisciurei TaxID=2661627 RepID=A0ABX0C7M1_9BIFI|nr:MULTISPECIES: type I-C CRISPR-associated protein Cas8c/Csd1 [Bifidobacterium]NEG95716.1 type I-C CRISPR-associated protein Cas8c/Csd1 [Bifidobacterium sp. SMB2]NEH11143.1 type I-C CRISPR-associated protein Cas8c/Csd1 [Bifidobacterium saimiriisciurei]
MSLWSSLLQTYDAVQDITGIVPINSDGVPVVRKVLLPLFHTTMKTRLCITLNQHGELVSIEKDSEDFETIIPCTEQSAGRSGKNIPPHPLCDKLQYVDSKYDKVKYRHYMDQLAEWKGNNVKLNAIYLYLAEHSVIDDARSKGVEIHENKDKDLGVRFAVWGEDHVPETWMDREIWALWIQHEEPREPRNGFDMLGEDLHKASYNFPKNIVSIKGNAKLISSNDEKNFTFRGRFIDQREALSIDSLTSQKVHLALRWLVNNNGTLTDTQDIVVWAVDKQPTEHIVDYSGNSYDVYESLRDFYYVDDDTEENDILTDSEKLSAAHSQVAANYADRFGKLLRGYGEKSALDAIKEHSRRIVVAILDAATPGRLSVTFYRELAEDEYIENVIRWHEDSAWNLTRFESSSDGDRSEVSVGKRESSSDSRRIDYIGAPSFKDIINCVYDSDDCNRNKTGYIKFTKKVKKQLVECMFGNNNLPQSLLQAAFRRVTRPQSYTANKDRRKNEMTWRRDFEVACSMWRKHFIEQERRRFSEVERNPMALLELDDNRRDRDYLYGRLLALADSFEYRVLKNQQKRNSASSRATNAIRLMNSFSAKPFVTWGNLWSQLQPYLKSAYTQSPLIAKGFQDDIDCVINAFKPGDFEDNSTLSALFLLGYSHERKYLMDQMGNKGNKSHVSETNEGE